MIHSSIGDMYLHSTFCLLGETSFERNALPLRFNCLHEPTHRRKKDWGWLSSPFLSTLPGGLTQQANTRSSIRFSAP
jgi:hypothetical protein